MYEIKKSDSHLLVEFQGNFDYSMIQTIIRHTTMMKEYPHTNDIWLIGNHNADIRLGELETMVRDFHCSCPTDATRTKTAVVVDEGLTGTIFELWVKGIQKRVTFEIRIFQTLKEAEGWLNTADEKVA
jgi:hypothetical protein